MVTVWYFIATLGLSYNSMQFASYSDCVEYRLEYIVDNLNSQVSRCYPATTQYILI